MQRYVLYNDDIPVALFDVFHNTIQSFLPKVPELLPMQIRSAAADGFTLWLRERAIDLNAVQHRASKIKNFGKMVLCQLVQ